MSRTALFAIDLAAIAVMTFGLYFPRHRRRDLVVAYLIVNLGVLAVADALASSTVNAGLGLGLFGVLSIIRLRSSELDQQEVAYYFAALALGLLCGLTVTPEWLAPALAAAILSALYIGDHPRLFGRHRQQTMLLDRAFVDEDLLRGHLSQLLDARIRHATVRKVDLVSDTTLVDVRYELPATRPSVARGGHEVIGIRP